MRLRLRLRTRDRKAEGWKLEKLTTGVWQRTAIGHEPSHGRCGARTAARCKCAAVGQRWRCAASGMEAAATLGLNFGFRSHPLQLPTPPSVPPTPTQTTRFLQCAIRVVRAHIALDSSPNVPPHACRPSWYGCQRYGQLELPEHIQHGTASKGPELLARRPAGMSRPLFARTHGSRANSGANS